MLLILTILIILTSLSACGGVDNMFGRIGRLNREIMSERKKADKTLNLVLESCKRRDKNLLKTAFSTKALNELIDLDDSIENLFNVFEFAYVVNYDEWADPHTSTENEFGIRTVEANMQYEIQTNSKIYYLYIREYFEDMKNPDNVGIETIVVMPLELSDEKFGKTDDWAMPGIYVFP